MAQLLDFHPQSGKKKEGDHNLTEVELRESKNKLEIKARTISNLKKQFRRLQEKRVQPKPLVKKELPTRETPRPCPTTARDN